MQPQNKQYFESKKTSKLEISSDQNNANNRLWTFICDPEWKNYLKREWKNNPLCSVIAPIQLGLRLSRFIGAQKLKIPTDQLGKKFSINSTEKYNSEYPPIEKKTDWNREPQHLFSGEDIPFLTSYAKLHFSKEVASLETAAKKLIEGVFPLTGESEINHQNSVSWKGPFSDPEHLFYLNRWYHGITLAKVGLYTGKNEYLKYIFKLLREWSQANPIDNKSPVWESYSVGERIVNWLFIHYLLRGLDLYGDREAQFLCTLVTEHAEYLANHLEEKNIHNHLINNARALFICGILCPAYPHAEALRNLGWKILIREINRQFRDDGMLGEQSTHYHLLLLNRYVEVTLLAQRNGYLVPSAFLHKLKQMFTVGNLFVRADQSMVTVGDVSPDILPSELIGILSVGSALFDVPSAIFPNESSLWFLGCNGLEKWTPNQMRSGLHQLPESGYTCYKTSNIHFLMQCDPRAEVIRHGHNDVLGISLWVKGHSILVDPGNASFKTDKWGLFFREATSHNSITVDGMPPYIRSATVRSLLPKQYSSCEARFLKCEQKDEEVTIEAQHSGYQRLVLPVTIRRQVQIREEESVFIKDIIRGSGEHFVEIFFQFGLNQVQIRKDGLTLDVYDPSDKKLAEVIFETDVNLEIELSVGVQSPKVSGWISSAYGIVRRSTTAICRLQMDRFVEVNSRIYLF